MIPEKVNVCGVEYNVVEVEEIEDDPNVMGSCIYQKALIKIKASMAESKKGQTFVHELLHACFNEAGFQEQDEDVINRVSIVLYQVLKDNQINFFEGRHPIRCFLFFLERGEVVGHRLP